MASMNHGSKVPVFAALICAALGWVAVTLNAADPTIESLMTQANAAFQQGNTDLAVAFASKAIEVAPERADGYYVRARIHARVGRLDKAIADYDTVVQLTPKAHGVLLRRAQLHARLHQYHAALNDYDAFLQSVPEQEPDAYQRRGELRFKMADINGALADFDRYLELVPNRGPYHWQRGIALYYADRFDDGRRQFESHQSVNPHDVENAVWHFLCVTRAVDIDAARRKLIPISGDRRVPMAQIHDLFAGKGDAEAVLAAASKESQTPAQRSNHLFYAHLYLGLYQEILGNTARSREHMLKSVHDYPQDHYMGDVARVHARLRGWKRDDPSD